MRARIKNARGWHVSDIRHIHKLDGDWSTVGLESPFFDAQRKAFYEGDVVEVDGRCYEVEFDPIFGFVPFVGFMDRMLFGNDLDPQLDFVINLGNKHDNPNLMLKRSLELEEVSKYRVDGKDILDDLM